MNIDSINLKEASVSDIPILIELEKSVAGIHIYSPMLEESEWKEAFEKGKVYLIQKGDTVVGNLSYEQKSNDHLHISGLVITPPFQGQGIAREVVTKLLAEFRGVKRIDLVTHPDNLSALKLYESLGFVIESRQKNYYGDNEPRLVLMLSKK